MAEWNDLSRVWFDLERWEDKLKWNGSQGTGPQYDSMGLPTGSTFLNWGREQRSRVSRLREALDLSGPIAQRLVIQSLAGLDLSTVWDILVKACKDVAIYYCGSMAAGGVLGAAGGFFFGGAGAWPGAAAGVAAGSYIGGVILGMLGLKSIIEESSLALPEVLTHYQRGFGEAWGPARQDPQHGMGSSLTGDTHVAAGYFAQGHVVLIIAILSGILAYVTRGRGDKTVLLNEIGRSPRLGPKMANWVSANVDRLQKHPALQSRRRGSAGVEPTPPPKKKPGPDDNHDHKPRRMPKADVPCFEPNDLPKEKLPEFDRQLAGQEAGLNNMTVEEYLEGRKAFGDKTRVRNRNIAKKARDRFEATLRDKTRAELVAAGTPLKEAKMMAIAEAAKKMATMAALHNPDMIAGGKDVIKDFGDRNVNSRIGPQWTSRIARLDEAAEAAKSSFGGKAMLNAKLERCKR